MVVSTSDKLTKEQAIKSLGKGADTYKVHTFAKKGEEEETKKDEAKKAS